MLLSRETVRFFPFQNSAVNEAACLLFDDAIKPNKHSICLILHLHCIRHRYLNTKPKPNPKPNPKPSPFLFIRPCLNSIDFAARHNNKRGTISMRDSNNAGQ